MILSDGTDTREEVKRPGPYCDGMAVWLDRESMGGGGDDIYGGEDGGGYVVRIGRRLLLVDSQGFKESQRFENVEQAVDACVQVFGDGEYV